MRNAILSLAFHHPHVSMRLHMATRNSGTTPKRRVWRVSPQTPQGEYIDPDAVPVPAVEREPRPNSGWHVSSFELTDGLDVQEHPDDVPDEMLAQLFNR